MNSGHHLSIYITSVWPNRIHVSNWCVFRFLIFRLVHLDRLCSNVNYNKIRFIYLLAFFFHFFFCFDWFWSNTNDRKQKAKRDPIWFSRIVIPFASFIRQHCAIVMVFDAFCFHSDELLNYEIGDVEADDTVLTGADEDELLLSDDGKWNDDSQNP